MHVERWRVGFWNTGKMYFLIPLPVLRLPSSVSLPPSSVFGPLSFFPLRLRSEWALWYTWPAWIPVINSLNRRQDRFKRCCEKQCKP